MVLLSLLLASPPSNAGLGTLVRGAAKLGKMGKGAKGLAGAGKLAKGGVAIKGAATMGAVAAAEGVFRFSDDLARPAVFVAREADDQLRLVSRAGKELTTDGDGLAKGVGAADIYLDREALALADSLPADQGGRLYLANPEGPSLPLHRTEQGLMVELDPGLLIDAGSLALDMGLSAGELEPDFQAVAALDVGDCEVAYAARAMSRGLEFRALATPSDAMTLADQVDGDLLIIGPPGGLAGVHEYAGWLLQAETLCVDGQAPPNVTGAMTRALEAQTFEQVWGAIGTVEAPAELEAREGVDALRTRSSAAGMMVASAIPLPSAYEQAVDEDPPLWFVITVFPFALMIACLMVVPGPTIGLLRRVFGRKREE